MLEQLALIILTLLVLNIYGYHGIRKLFALTLFAKQRKFLSLGYWIVDIGFVLFSLVWAIIIRTSAWPDYVQYRNYFYITGAFVLIYIPRIVFLIFVLADDLKVLTVSFVAYLRGNLKARLPIHWHSGYMLPLTGIILSAIMFAWVSFGVAYGRFNFKIQEVQVEVAGLPESFYGFRIIHISDTHFGSFVRKRPVQRAVNMIQDTPHDILVFTGDMINNDPAEATRFIQLFYNIKSPEGKFSILGNHDLGDYRRWYLIEERMPDVEKLVDVQESMGFNVLRNEHHFITRGNDSLMIAGIYNWGLPPFEQYGDLDKALGKHSLFPFKILLSHDPSHWREEVIPQTDIFLTLSGHTHGMQSGIVTPWFQWSPVSVKYPEWGGLYSYENQNIYVNRGLGFLGFPGRIGMSPEITVITLVAKK